MSKPWGTLPRAAATNAAASALVAIDAVEAGRVAEQLARLGEARLAAERAPGRPRLPIVLTDTEVERLIAALTELWAACPVGKGEYVRLAAE